MVRSRWLSWLVSVVGLVIVASSCGGTDPEPSRPEPGNGGADATGGAAAGDTSQAGAPTLPGRPDGLPWLGMACRKAEDCGEQGLRCLSSAEDFRDGQGAPPGGLCTADCQTDADCRSFDPSAVCATFAEAPLVLAYAAKTVPRLCVQGCTLGSPRGATKCHGRSDFACRPFAPDHPATCLKPDEVCPNGTFCYRGACRELGCGPRCNADQDCGGGRHCNAFTGLCDLEATASTPIGADCSDDVEGGSNSCGGGNCLQIDDQEGVRVKRMCTQSCTIGQVCAGGAGACVWPRFDDFALGDVGYCVQKCDCDRDCAHPVDRCVPWGDADTERAYGSRGTCSPPTEGTITLACEGGAGGAPASGGASGAPASGGASGAPASGGAGGASAGNTLGGAGGAL